MSWLSPGKKKQDWLTKTSEDSFLTPKKAKGGSFLFPDVDRHAATERIHGETQLRDAIHHLEHQPEIQKATHEAEMAAKAAALASAKATEALTNTALANAMDFSTHNAVRLEQEKVKTELDKAKGLSKIKVDEAKKLEDNRLRGYREEVEIDIRAAVGMHMLDIEKLDYLLQKIARLKSENANPDRIATFERVCEQMERRLLEAPEQQPDVDGTKETS